VRIGGVLGFSVDQFLLLPQAPAHLQDQAGAWWVHNQLGRVLSSSLIASSKTWQLPNPKGPWWLTRRLD
jgi:hypothetical protein